MRIIKQAIKETPCRAVETFPFILTFKKDERPLWSKEIMEWGNETYGRFAFKWAASAPNNRIEKAYFHSREDAMLFVMRWAGDIK